MRLTTFALKTMAIALLGLGVAIASGQTTNKFIDLLDTAAKPTAKPGSRTVLALSKAGQRLVGVGWRGLIAYSDDGGASWQQAQVPVSVDLTAVYFVTPQLGWAVGHAGVVLHSRDAGTTWQRQLDGRGVAKLMRGHYQAQVDAGDAGAAKFLSDAELSWGKAPTLPWLGVRFLDDKRGWVVGPFNMSLYTEDGGATWAPQLEKFSNPDALHLNGIHASDGVLYMASERGFVFRRRPGEERFEALKTGYSGSFLGVCGRGNTVYAYGLRGNVYRSADAGQTWDGLSSGVSDTITGCAVDQGRVILSTLGGQLISTALLETRFENSATLGVGSLFSVTTASPEAVVVAGRLGVQRRKVIGAP